MNISFNVKHIFNQSSSGLEIFPRGPIRTIDQTNPNWEYLVSNSVKNTDDQINDEDQPFKFRFFSKDTLGTSHLRLFEIFKKDYSLKIIDVSLEKDNTAELTVDDLIIDMGLIVRDDQVVIINYDKKLFKDGRPSLFYKCYLYEDNIRRLNCIGEEFVNT